MQAAEKARLRREIRARCPGAQAIARESAAICQRLISWPAFEQAACVAGYMPLKHEAQIQPVLEEALLQGKTLLLPRVESRERMTFRRVDSLTDLEIGAYGLLEPRHDAPAWPIGQADMVLVPLEAVDDAGQRLGKGGGYYDRALADYQGRSVGIALPWQRVRQLPTQPHDRMLDNWIVSDTIEPDDQ